MRSGRIREQDTVVWVGSPDKLGVGSSMKAYEVTRTHVGVSKIGGTYQERVFGPTEFYRRGTEFVSCREAARRGIEPWASVDWDGTP